MMRALALPLSLLAMLSYLISPALAGTGTITVLDASSVSHTYDVTTDGTGNFVSKGVICDQSAAANCATVDSNHNLQVSQPTAANLNATVVNAGTFAVQASQATAANLNATVVGTGTFPVQATLQASGTTAIGKVDPNTIGNWGLQVATQNSATPTNGGLVEGQFNTSPTTITSGNVSPLQMDSAGNLLVNVKAGGGSGGTSSTFGSAFPSTGTAIGLTNGTNMVAWSATSNYGTAPSAIAVPAVNAFVTNANGNGQTTMASSSPVVLASNQSVADPCMFQLKSSAPISLTASGQVITGTASKKTYVCSIDLISATLQNVALVEGTGSTCATNIFGLAGGTTAATGWNFAANGGLTKGSGAGTVVWGSGDTNATAANVCLLSSSTGQISGSIQYVQQ